MTDLETSAPPTPVSPIGGAVVDGSAISFLWAAIEDARAYSVQVAPDRQFAHDVVEVNAGRTTNVVMHDSFIPSESPRFWRVRAETSIGYTRWSPYGRFYTGSDAAVDEFRQAQDAKKIARRLEAGRLQAEKESQLELIPYVNRDDMILSDGTTLALGLTMIASFVLVIASILLATMLA